MSKLSAGIVLYRVTNGHPEVFLCHPGGPYYRNKNKGVWSIPKGMFTKEEDPLAAARREFEEETGQKVEGHFIPLDLVKTKSGKTIFAFMAEGDADAGAIVSNTFLMEWPPKSGKMIAVPEMDKAAWFSLEEAETMILPSQLPLLTQVIAVLHRQGRC